MALWGLKQCPRLDQTSSTTASLQAERRELLSVCLLVEVNEAFTITTWRPPELSKGSVAPNEMNSTYLSMASKTRICPVPPVPSLLSPNRPTHSGYNDLCVPSSKLIPSPTFSSLDAPLPLKSPSQWRPPSRRVHSKMPFPISPGLFIFQPALSQQVYYVGEVRVGLM